jgi:hypothetical protein
VVTNEGDCELTVTVTDSELGVVYGPASLAAGASDSFSASATLSTTTTNIATASGVDQFGVEVTATASFTVTVIHPDITVTKTGTPDTQIAPGTVTWTITVTNNGDVPLTNVVITDTRHGSIDTIATLAVSQTVTYTIVETSLGPGIYEDCATATGTHQLGEVTDSDCAEVEVTAVYKLKQFTEVGTLCGGDAELVDDDTVAVYGIKTGPAVYFNVTYYFENTEAFLGDDYDGETHNFVLWDKWGGNLMVLGSKPVCFDSELAMLTLDDGSGFNINPRATGMSYRDGYIGSGLQLDSSLVSQGDAWITMHLGDQQQKTNPGKGKGTTKDSTSYDADVTWYIGELAPGEGAWLRVVVAPGMNPGGQLEFTSLGVHTINTGPRVRVYGDTFENEDFL